MRGPFSIEWLAQSSQTPQLPTAGPARPAAPAGPAGPAASHAESLPGFYRRRTAEAAPPERLQPPRRTESRVSDVSTSSDSDSDYESEGGRRSLSLSPSRRHRAAPPSPQYGRRSRTAFTAAQIGCLEKSFKRSAYLGTQEKAELCRTLGLSDKQVRNWFQNRRMKMKRSMQDALAHACQASAAAASQLLFYPNLQAYRAGVPHRYPAIATAPMVVAVAPDGLATPAVAATYRPPAGLQYGAALPVDSFCQYNGVPAVVMPAPPPPPPRYRTAYQNFPQYY